MRHELRQVRAFLKVAELESFTRAAAELHISQSALTVQVKQLEEELGILLFDRDKRGATITAAGRDLLGPLRRLLFDAEAIIGYASDMSEVRAGNFSIAALPSIAAVLLPRAMQAFRQTNPKVRIEVHDVVADRVRELVVKRTVDFGLGTASRQDREIRAMPLYYDRLAAFVPAEHKLSLQSEVTLRELAACEMILPNRESSVRRMVEVGLVREHLANVVRHEVNYMPTALAMVRRGLGIAILPELAAESNSREVVRVSIQGPVMRRQVCLLLKAGRTLSPAAARFLEAFRSQIPVRTRPRESSRNRP